ncbi:hypothetical protein FOCG_18261 [Fusarium oxysporum f. sp. radicis-lycopersici 26381]|nr:hypothetical protein FOCG_18261 [Fusarium oxysporum f. sp. radicis-lycopersici 26381]
MVRGWPSQWHREGDEGEEAIPRGGRRKRRVEEQGRVFEQDPAGR